MNDSNYQRLFDRQRLILTEKEAVEVLINRKSKTVKEEVIYDLPDFLEFVTPDLELPEIMSIDGLYIATNVLRQDLDFDSDKKPGDFDLIVIPYIKDSIFFNRTGVYEVKIVKPTRKKPQKNANSLGTTQLKGLISDGFPFVGLMHICMTEPLNDNEKTVRKFCTVPANSGQKIPPGKTLEDFLVQIKADDFQWYSVDKQIKRIISLDIPKYVNLFCLGLGLQQNTYSFDYGSTNLKNFQGGYFNPYQQEDTIEKIAIHFSRFPSLYYKRKIR